ncbi:MAG TPA: hypothetical protein VFE91_03855, partial [Nitrososphaerales archaeon]|nr:hypothetical protein [Nitrososphaerales archaeon]
KNLILLFTNSVSDFRQALTNVSQRKRASLRLSNAYDLLRNAGAVKDGRATKRKMAQKDDAVKELESRLLETAMKLGVMEHRLQDCADEKIGLENIIKEQKERIDNTRAEDMKNSFGSQKSKAEESQ